MASVVASSGMTAQITVTGSIAASTGSVGPAAVGSNFTKHAGTGSGTSLTVDVRIINSVVNGVQTFSVDIESLKFDKYISGQR